MSDSKSPVPQVRELPWVRHMCQECRRGYITARPHNPQCHACGGALVAIKPRPNRHPYVNGAFVSGVEPPELPVYNVIGHIQNLGSKK